MEMKKARQATGQGVELLRACASAGVQTTPRPGQGMEMMHVVRGGPDHARNLTAAVAGVNRNDR